MFTNTIRGRHLVRAHRETAPSHILRRGGGNNSELSLLFELYRLFMRIFIKYRNP